MSQRQIAAFDFDGTITKRDTLFPFLKKYGLLNLLLPLISSTANRRSLKWRDALKVQMIRKVFADISVSKFEEDGIRYAETLNSKYRDDVLALLSWHRKAGHELVLVTASLGCYARPAATKLGFDHVIAVELASESGLLSGEISGNNIRGPEKARRLRQWIGPTDVEIWAYGNSSGDKEMLSMADHSRWV
ncbi:MAG: hypothetical protein MB53_03385 [marine actinobacterium MedAcidi-G2A]|nr:MAG: hypothetical protein MB53_03385 [marine actinobacterium MedAcidi-G2A]|tara:strand:- start:31 stop:600 length:570 start_codon:yes stop_codon:yes gene_type:complete